MQQLQCGATQDMNFWRPDLKMHWGLPERDNHGRLYVYFSPHDRVMGATPLQSIGWQGLDDKLLDELGDTVKQRMLARGTPCGDEPGVQKFGDVATDSGPAAGRQADRLLGRQPGRARWPFWRDQDLGGAERKPDGDDQR